MSPALLQLLHSVELSLSLSLITISVSFSFRIMRFPDLTAEGAFGLSAMSAAWLSARTDSAWAGLACGTAVGAACGAVTAFLASGAKLPTIFSGILTSTMAIAIGLILFRQPNMDVTVKLPFIPDGMLSTEVVVRGAIFSAALLCAVILSLTVSLHSGFGLLLRTRGDNPLLLQSFGRSLLQWDIAGLLIAGAIVGCSAAVFSQRAGYASTTMGTGLAINALAAVMTAEAVFPSKTMLGSLLGCVLATFLLQLIRLLALSFGLPDGALNLLTSVIVISLFYVAKRRTWIRTSVLERIRL